MVVLFQTEYRNMSSVAWASKLLDYLTPDGVGSPARQLTDHMDVVYLAQILEALAPKVTSSNKVSQRSF